MNSELTREQWLNQMAGRMSTELFLTNGYTIKAKFRVSCGLPSKGAFSKKLRRIGEAWHPKCSEDGTAEIFISPTVADSITVAGVLAHELVHVCVGNENGHNKVFKKCATDIGLTGKMTETNVSNALKEWIGEQVKDMGEFPHAVLDHSQKKKQGTRMLKIVCDNGLCAFSIENDKPYTVRMSNQAYDYAQPVCGCCKSRMEIAEK